MSRIIGFVHQLLHQLNLFAGPNLSDTGAPYNMALLTLGRSTINLQSHGMVNTKGRGLVPSDAQGVIFVGSVRYTARCGSILGHSPSQGSIPGSWRACCPRLQYQSAESLASWQTGLAAGCLVGR